MKRKINQGYVRTNIYISPRTRDLYKMAGMLRKVTMSEVMREALDKYINETKIKDLRKTEGGENYE